MLRRLVDKVAVITGSTEGIGYAIANGFLAEGARVVISSRKEEKVTRAVSQLSESFGNRVVGIPCSVGLSDQRERLFNFAIEQYGRIDIVVSNVAISPHFGSVLDTPERTWRKIFENNVDAAFSLVKLAAPYLERSGGCVLFVSSIAAYTPLANIGAYSVSKTALLGLTKTLSQELSPMGVRVNGIAPGIIRTNFSRLLYEDPDVHEQVVAQIPLRRIGEVSDCVGPAVMLCSSDAAYITGETIVIAGGMPSHL